jgi:hypothetical protein
MLRIPQCLDNWFTDGGDVVSLKHRRLSTLQKYLISVSGTPFCWKLRNPQGLLWPEGLGKLMKFNYVVGSRTHDFPACTIAPQSLRYGVTSRNEYLNTNIRCVVRDSNWESKQIQTQVNTLGLLHHSITRHITNMCFQCPIQTIELFVCLFVSLDNDFIFRIVMLQHNGI